MVNLRADGGGPVSIVDADTGSLLGTMDSPQTHYQAHTGAVYVHQGDSYVVEDLNEDDHCVVVRRANPDFYTTARDITQIEVLETERTAQWGDVAVHFGDVKVTTQVVSFQRKALISNEVLGEEPLELGARELFTKAVWFVMDNRSLSGAGLLEAQFPGALHAAEHAAIGLLPLVASSDRWDIGGVSTAIHADTGVPTATRDAIKACECESGCPSCVQSPKCGNKNNPLDKAAAVTLIDVLLRDAKETAAHQKEYRASAVVPTAS
jgi:DEAD/DEAH box helicase domain-containing protein